MLNAPTKTFFLILLLALGARWGAGVFVERQIAAKNAARETPVDAAADDDEAPADAYAGDPDFLFPDSADFDSAARNLLVHGEHVDAHNRRAWRTPLYSIMLALCAHLGRDDSVEWLRWLNRWLDVLNVWLVYRLARAVVAGLRRETGDFAPSPGVVGGVGGVGRGGMGGMGGLADRLEWVPVIAMAIYAFDPWSVYFSNLILADTPGNTATLLTMLAFARWLHPGDPATDDDADVHGKRGQSGGAYPAGNAGWALAAGAASGLAVLVKPSLSLLAGAFLGFALLTLAGRQGQTKPSVRTERNARRGWRFAGGAVLALMGWVLVMSPWWARNHRVFGAFVPFSTMGGFTLYESLGPGAGGGANLGSVDLPESWKTKRHILAANLEIYAFHHFAPQPPRRDPDELFGTASLEEFRRRLTRIALDEPLHPGQDEWEVLREDGRQPPPPLPPTDAAARRALPFGAFYLFAPDPGSPPLIHRFLADADADADADAAEIKPDSFPDNEGSGRIHSKRWRRKKLPPAWGPVGYPSTRRPPDWISQPGRVNLDFAPLQAFLELDADRRLLDELNRFLDGAPEEAEESGESDDLKKRAGDASPAGGAGRLGRVARLAPEKWRRLWNPFPNFGGAANPLYHLASAGHFLPLAILSLAALAAYRRHWRVIGLLLAPALYLTAVHAVFLGSIRYRLPAVAGLSVLAALGVVHLWSALEKHGRGKPAGAGTKKNQ